MNWLKDITKEMLSREIGDSNFQDGFQYTWTQWEKELDRVADLYVGEKIYNPYNGAHTTITKIEFEWFQVLTGEAILGYYIKDNLDYLIYKVPT